MSDATFMQRLLELNPGLARKITQFMILRDAADVLTELKPPNGDLTSAYLAETADHLIRDAGVPEDFLQAMITARPPLETARIAREATLRAETWPRSSPHD